MAAQILDGPVPARCPRCTGGVFTVRAQVTCETTVLNGGERAEGVHVLAPCVSTDDAGEFHVSTECVHCGLTFHGDGTVTVPMDPANVERHGPVPGGAVEFLRAVTKPGLARMEKGA